MSEASKSCPRPTLQGQGNGTSSPGSAPGRLLSGWRGSLTTRTSGLDLVHVRDSRRPESAGASTILATSGPSGSSSFAPADLQSCLASRLRALLDGSGSTLYSLTWKAKDTPARRRICRLVASVRRIGDSDCSSWPTPTVSTGDYSRRDGNPDEPILKLSGVAKLATWPTPTVSDSDRGGQAERCETGRTNLRDFVMLASWATPTVQDTTGAKTPEQIEAMRARAPQRTSGGPPGISNLNEQAQLASWATPVSRDHKSGGFPGQLSQQAQLAGSGPARTGSCVATERCGQLNPAHARWLMGLTPAWDDCAPTGTRSCRR